MFAGLLSRGCQQSLWLLFILDMHFAADVRSFAEDSKRSVTGGMDTAGVSAICLTWREIRKF